MHYTGSYNRIFIPINISERNSGLEEAKRVMTETKSLSEKCLVPGEMYSLSGACCSALQSMRSYEMVFPSHLSSHGACRRVNSNRACGGSVIRVPY